jgi:RNA polymerase sigma factor (sigma-70 family)
MSSTRDQNQTSATFRRDVAAMFTTHRPMVLRAALRITGNDKDAEDVLQNVFTRLIQRPALQGDFCANPAGYLYRAAKHEALNLLEARQCQKLTGVDITTLEIPAKERDLDSEDKMQRIRAGMMAMNPESIEILTLFYCEGYRCGEIAKIRKKKVHAIMMELCRARTGLQKVIKMQEKQREIQKAKHQRNRCGTFAETSKA